MKKTWLQVKFFQKATLLLLVFLSAICLNVTHSHAADYTAAPTLPLNGAWSSEYWLSDTNHEQWYKLVIPSDGKLTYKVMGYTYVRYSLYNSDLSECPHYNGSSGSETSPDTDGYDVPLSKGIYYLKVYKGNNGKYKLNMSFTSYNVNDTGAISYDSPQTISLSSTITGALTFSDTEDWYRINIPVTGYYHYQVSAYTYVRYSLYNSDLSECPHYNSSSGSETSPDTDGYDVVLSAGTYYFKIYKGNSGKYTFRISPLSQSSCNHDYKTTYINSTYTQQGYTHHQCSKCGHAYNDNYKARLVLNTPSIYLYAGRKRITVSWYSVYNASGYQISYKINGRTRTIKTKGHYKTIKRLKPHKKCVVRVRAYKRAGNQTVYSRWSPKKSVRIQ